MACGCPQGRTRDEAFRIGSEIAAAVTRANPSPVTLKFEKVWARLGGWRGACMCALTRAHMCVLRAWEHMHSRHTLGAHALPAHSGGLSQPLGASSLQHPNQVRPPMPPPFPLPPPQVNRNMFDAAVGIIKGKARLHPSIHT